MIKFQQYCVKAVDDSQLEYNLNKEKSRSLKIRLEREYMKSVIIK